MGKSVYGRHYSEPKNMYVESDGTMIVQGTTIDHAAIFSPIIEQQIRAIVRDEIKKSGGAN